MKNRKDKKREIISTALRGGEIWRLKIKRFMKGTLWSVGISAAVGLGFSLVYIFRREPDVFHYTKKYAEAGYRYLSGSFWSSLPVGGRQAAAQQAYEAQALMERLGLHLSGLVQSALPWGLLGFGLGFCIWLLWYKRGGQAGADEVVRGGNIVKPKELASLIKKNREVGPLQICGVPMVSGVRWAKPAISCGCKSRPAKAVAGRLGASLAGVMVTWGPKRRQRSCGVWD
jgi:hypothetical protein